MKRPIKFRAWDKHTKKMWQWDDHNAFTTGKGSIKQWFNDSDLIQMQYTDTKDKNNVEVYEHDIITHSHDGMVGVVTWSPGLYRFVIENLAQTEIIADLCDYDADPEVLGNIYENQELLDGRQ